MTSTSLKMELILVYKHKVIVSVLFVCKDTKIMLRLYRLGHPCFLYLKQLLPELSKNKTTSLFSCEVCQLAKHYISTKKYVGCRNHYKD